MKTANDCESTDAQTKCRDQGRNVSLEEVRSVFREIKQLRSRNFAQRVPQLEQCEFDPIPPRVPPRGCKTNVTYAEKAIEEGGQETEVGLRVRSTIGGHL